MGRGDCKTMGKALSVLATICAFGSVAHRAPRATGPPERPLCLHVWRQWLARLSLPWVWSGLLELLLTAVGARSSVMVTGPCTFSVHGVLTRHKSVRLQVRIQPRRILLCVPAFAGVIVPKRITVDLSWGTGEFFTSAHSNTLKPQLAGLAGAPYAAIDQPGHPCTVRPQTLPAGAAKSKHQSIGRKRCRTPPGPELQRTIFCPALLQRCRAWMRTLLT